MRLHAPIPDVTVHVVREGGLGREEAEAEEDGEREDQPQGRIAPPFSSIVHWAS